MKRSSTHSCVFTTDVPDGPDPRLDTGRERDRPASIRRVGIDRRETIRTDSENTKIPSLGVNEYQIVRVGSAVLAGGVIKDCWLTLCV